MEKSNLEKKPITLFPDDNNYITEKEKSLK